MLVFPQTFMAGDSGNLSRRAPGFAKRLAAAFRKPWAEHLLARPEALICFRNQLPKISADKLEPVPWLNLKA